MRKPFTIKSQNDFLLLEASGKDKKNLFWSRVYVLAVVMQEQGHFSGHISKALGGEL
jgi:hypothetical protein